jgi:putative two-component system response regulator
MLQNVLSDSLTEQKINDIKACFLESFAKEIDHSIQSDLLTRLVLDYSSITRQLELLNKELSLREEMLVEAQKIAMLGRWDYYPDTGSMIWSQSLYYILEADSSIPASLELFLSRVHPDDYEDVARLYSRLFDKNESLTIKYRLITADNRIKWLHLRCSPAADSRGRTDTSHYYGTIQDITEMKTAEEELEKYSQHLETLVEEKVREISASQMATIYALIKLSESRDDETGTHIERTASFCRLLAEKARSQPKYANEIDDSFIETIFKASPLHDIGKVGIPDSILLKPGKLTDEEFAVMKTHVQIGYETLAKVGEQYGRNEFLEMGMDIALYHHEKWDGSGYNEGLFGEKIPLSARIMAISDVYDALRSKRVYKEAYSHEKSLEVIYSGKGIHFDPTLTDIFLQAEEEFRLLYDSTR